MNHAPGSRRELFHGEMAERPMALVLKTSASERASGVQIPLSPPFCIHSKGGNAMSPQLYRVTYTVLGDFEDISRSTYVFAVSATSAREWVERYWKKMQCRSYIEVHSVSAVAPMVGKIVATTWDAALTAAQAE